MDSAGARCERVKPRELVTLTLQCEATLVHIVELLLYWIIEGVEASSLRKLEAALPSSSSCSMDPNTTERGKVSLAGSCFE